MTEPKGVQKTALNITHAIGSPTSILIHTIIFALSFLAAVFGYLEWNEMLLILTTILSLEAIYLSLFIQMTVNYTTEAVEDISEDVEEMQEDVGEIQEDIDELQEDVEDISEEDLEDEQREAAQQKTLSDIQRDLQKLMQDISKLQNK